MMDVLAGGRFSIVRRIAHGGMGEVLLADFVGDDELGLSSGLLVVKRILPTHPDRQQQAAMLREEGRVALRLMHPNLVDTFFLDEHEGDPLLIMELVSGRAVSQILGQAKKRKETIPVPIALAILRGAAAGLHFAHTLTDADGGPLGLIHRDVSPANLIVTFTGGLKVIDFGVAKADDSEIRTSTGILKGKLGYMSPEHALGQKLTTAADIWSLGVCFWETLCADRLFTQSSPSATLLAITEEPIPSPAERRPDLPAEVVALCQRLLDRDLRKRLSTGAAVVDAIDALPQAAQMRDTDVGAWLAQRFPAEAERAREDEGRRALRLRSPPDTPVVLGIPLEEDWDDTENAPTAIMDPSLLRKAHATLLRGDALVGLSATAPEQQPLTAQDRDASRPPVDLHDDSTREVRHVAVAEMSTSAEGPRPAEPLVTPVTAAATASSSPATPAAVPRATTPPAQAVPVRPPMASAQPSGQTRPMRPGHSTKTQRRGASALPPAWVACFTFGALALAIGVAFSFLSPPLSFRGLAAFPDGGGRGDVIVALRDAPPGARGVDLEQPVLMREGVAVAVPRDTLVAALEAAGVMRRASLPTTTQGMVALLLPLLIVGLGLFALATALPVLLLKHKHVRLAAQVLLLLSAAGLMVVALKGGALSWPGLDVLQQVPRVEARTLKGGG